MDLRPHPRNVTPRLLSVLFAALAAGCASPPEQPTRPTPPTDRTSIVLVLARDLSPDDVSVYGAGLAWTPRIDRIADEGVLFENAFAGEDELHSLRGGESMAVAGGRRVGCYLGEPVESALDFVTEDPAPFLLLWGSGETVSAQGGKGRTLDEAVGRLLDGLEQAGRADDTAVIFTATPHTSLQGPRDARIPLLVRWPARIEAGRRVDALVRGADLLPTLHAIADSPPPEDLQGMSLFGFLVGEAPAEWRDSFRCDVRLQGQECDPGQLVRTRRYALLRNERTGSEALFDLALDPLGTRDRIDDPAYDDVRARLEERIATGRGEFP